MLTKKKVLIIKLGHSETLDPEISKECSLGDVVRTTVLLNYFKDSDHVTWLCDEKAEPLLRDNPYIDNVLVWDFEIALLLQQEYFDVVVNLEKSPGLCALAEQVKGYLKYGFRLSQWSGKAEAYQHTQKVLEICYNQGVRDKNQKYWQEHLARVVDRRWSMKDKYILTPKDVEKKHDVGINWMVGKKWPEKAWELARWGELAKALESTSKSVSMQQVLALEEYMEWIASCRSLVTCDSLGMHLAIAYNIPVIALFGPTSPSDVYFYDKGKAIQAVDGKMKNISVQQVLDTIQGVRSAEAC